MKPRKSPKTETPLQTRQARVKLIQKLLSQELLAMMGASVALPSNFALAEAVVGRLDPEGKTPELLKIAALQQLAYEIGRTERPRRW
jgi:endonuclease V-like protein UPF0215 family